MVFKPMPSPIYGMSMWAAIQGNYTFLISEDHHQDNRVRASIKPAGAKPFDERRIDLGLFNSVHEAMEACRNWRLQ